MIEPLDFKCPSCTAAVAYDGRSETVICDFCGTTILMPESLRRGTATTGAMGSSDPATAAQIHQILDLVQQGKKIEAIKLYREAFHCSLAEAKDAVEQLEKGQPTIIQISPNMVATTTGATAAAGCYSCLFPIIVLLVIAGIGMAFFFNSSSDVLTRVSQAVEGGDIAAIMTELDSSVSQVATLNRTASGEALPVTAGGDGLAPDIMLETWALGSEGTPVYLSYTTPGDGSRQIVWENQIGDTSLSGQYNMAADQDHIYFTEQTALRAYAKDDGATVWETVLSDKVNANCQTCLRTVKDRLIVLTEDNTLEGFDTNNGRSAWQIRLENKNFAYPSEGKIAFAVVGDMVAVLDDADVDGTLRKALKFYDADSGEPRHQITPTCPDIQQFFPDDYLSHNSQSFLDETTGELVVLFGTTFVRQMCLQKWDALSGEMLWETRLPEGILPHSSTPGGLYTESSFMPYSAITAESLLTTLAVEPESSQPSVVKLDLATGEIPFQITDADYTLAPIGQQNGTILLRAEKQRGSDQIEIWGVDEATGERTWKHILEAQYLYEAEPFTDRYSYRLHPDGLVVLQLLTSSEPAVLKLQKLDTATGERLYETKTDMANAHFWSGLTWLPDRAYLVLSALHEANLETGAVSQSWP